MCQGDNESLIRTNDWLIRFCHGTRDSGHLYVAGKQLGGAQNTGHSVITSVLSREMFLLFRIDRASWNSLNVSSPQVAIVRKVRFTGSHWLWLNHCLLSMRMSDWHAKRRNKGKTQWYKNTQTDIDWPVEAKGSEMSPAGSGICLVGTCNICK